MASGSHRGDAITISDDEDEVMQHPPSRSKLIATSINTQHISARSSESLERTDFPGAKLSFRAKENRADLAFRQPSPASLTPHHRPHYPSAVRLTNFDSSARGSDRGRNGPLEKNDDLCPYYYDAKFELKMYRGPGFKQFHPVLGSVEGHKDICDKWDARQVERKNNGTQTHVGFRPLNSCTDKGSSLVDNATAQRDGAPFSGGGGFLPLDQEQEQHCLEQVLLVFPQVRHDFVRKLFREHHPGQRGSLAESQAVNAHVPGAIIAEIAEMKSFPKQKYLKRKHSPDTQDREDVTIRWNKDVLKNETYYKEALILLAKAFTRISTHFINRTLREKGTLYDTFHFLAESENTYNNSPRKSYSRYKLGRVALEKKYWRTATEQREGHQYISIVNEYQAAAQQQHRKETQKKRQKADEEAEANNFMVHQLQGSLVDCQCCFDEIPINRVVNCENDDAHFFCNKCINTRAKEQIGVLKYEMLCMDTSGCGAEMSKEALARALPVKISDKLAEIQQLAEIKAAGLEGLEQCPFCEYQAICAPVDVDNIFECLNPDCEKASCRKCKEESHLPRSCEEAKKEKGLSARHAIEEARSEAMMRSCPRCKVKIVKFAGCNKMTCSNCRAVMCYVCKKDITGRNYQHFGLGPTVCPIQDQPAENRHQQEADKAEKAAIAEAKARNADVNEEDLRIEAHLNQRPRRETEMARHRELQRPQPGFNLPAVPQVPLMDIGQGPLLVGGERAGLLTGEHAARMNTFQNVHQEAQQQHDRVRGMLEDHQQHLHRLHPFLPGPGVPPIPIPPKPNLGHVAPIRHAHQYIKYAYVRPAANGAPAQPIRNHCNVEPDEFLAARMQGFLQRDTFNMLGRNIAQNDHHDLLQRDGNIVQAEHQHPIFNNEIHYPTFWAGELNDLQNPRDKRCTQAQQQQSQAWNHV